jgi:hypothetical protein
MKDLSKSSLTPARVFKLLDKTLTDMIDDWYRNISGYYHIENVNEVDEFEPELKIFHDELGHRIKFAKDDLQCTYGLKVVEEEKGNTIEVSVNNKVKSIDYDEFLDRLRKHYDSAGDKAPGTNYAEIFLLSSDRHKAFSVIRSESKADIVRIGFQVDIQKVSPLLGDPAQLKAGVENYCLTPLRRIYAELYRKSKK